jgi:hypothetical protein
MGIPSFFVVGTSIFFDVRGVAVARHDCGEVNFVVIREGSEPCNEIRGAIVGYPPVLDCVPVEVAEASFFLVAAHPLR